MSNFSQFFPASSGGGTAGGGGLTNTYAAFNLNDGSDATRPVSPGYVPTTGFYTHPDGGVYLEQGKTFRDVSNTYPNATIQGSLNHNFAQPDSDPTNTTTDERMHFVPGGHPLGGTYGTIYSTMVNSWHVSFLGRTTVQRWVRQADGTFIKGTSGYMNNAGSQVSPPQNVVYDTTNQIFVAIKTTMTNAQAGTGQISNNYNIYTHTTPFRFDGAAASLWTQRATIPSVGASGTNNCYYPLATPPMFFSGNTGLTYIQPLQSANGNGIQTNSSFNASTYSRIAATLPHRVDVLEDGSRYLRGGGTTGFNQYSDGSATTLTDTFTDSTPGLGITSYKNNLFGGVPPGGGSTINPYWPTFVVPVSGGDIVSQASISSNSRGTQLYDFSFTATPFIGDGQVPGAITIPGITNPLPQTLFYKIG